MARRTRNAAKAPELSRGQVLSLALTPAWPDDVVTQSGGNPIFLVSNLLNKIPNTRLLFPGVARLFEVVTEEAPDLLDFYDETTLEDMQTLLDSSFLSESVTGLVLTAFNPIFAQDMETFLEWYSVFFSESKVVLRLALRLFLLGNPAATSVCMAVSNDETSIMLGPTLNLRTALMDNFRSDCFERVIRRSFQSDKRVNPNVVNFFFWIGEALVHQGYSDGTSYAKELVDLYKKRPASMSYASEDAWDIQFEDIELPSGIGDSSELGKLLRNKNMPGFFSGLTAQSIIVAIAKLKTYDSFLEEAATWTYLMRSFEQALGVARPAVLMLDRVL